MISQNFVSSSSLNLYIWCSCQFRLGGLHSSLLIFSKLIWLTRLYMWLSTHCDYLPFFVSALKGSWLLSICTASSKPFSFRMSHIKTCFLICYLLGKTFWTNSVAAKRKYVSKLMTSQPERFLSCLLNYLNAHIFNNPISMCEKHLVYFYEV